MHSARAEGREITVSMGHPDELFEPRPCDVAGGIPPQPPGIEQVRSKLDAGALRTPVTLAIELPPDHATPAVARGIKDAIRRYCDSGIARAQGELRAVHRDGLQALVLGAVVLAGFLLISEAIIRSGAPGGIRDFFGNGLFLVAAWVGMWYPLDTLLYSGRPHRHERRLLRAMRDMAVEVRPA